MSIVWSATRIAATWAAEGVAAAAAVYLFQLLVVEKLCDELRSRTFEPIPPQSFMQLLLDVSAEAITHGASGGAHHPKHHE